MLRFIYTYFEGEAQEAIDIYEEKVKLMNKERKSRQLMTGILLFDFLYVSALMGVKSDVSEKKIAALMKSKQLKDAGAAYKSVWLLLCVATVPDLSAITLPYSYQKSFPLSEVLFAMAFLRYQPQGSRAVYETVLETYFNPAYPLFLRDFPMALRKRFNYVEPKNTTSFFPDLAVLEPWERTLDLLLGVKKEGEKEAKGDTTPESRIIYLIDQWDQIQPKLQKLKNGSWSKGRNIALSTFRKGMPEMSETDRQLASTVKVVRESSYYGYPTESYELHGVKPLLKLAGCPLLFRADASEVAVEVSLEKPFLTVSRTKSGFKISHSLQGREMNGSCYYYWDGNTRIRVGELTKREREVFDLFAKVSVFPLAAEQKLTRVLATLSKEITIHSDLIAASDAVRLVEPDSSPVLQLIPSSSGFKGSIFVKPLGAYPPYCVPGDGADTVLGQIENETVQVIRNKKLEKQRFKMVREALADFEFVDDYHVEVETIPECLELLDTLFPLENVRVEWPEGGRLKLKTRAESGQFSLSTKGKGNWFELVGELKIDEESLELGALLEQLRENPRSRFVSLGKEEYVALSENLRKQLVSLESLAIKGAKEKLKISAFSAPILEGWAEEGVQLKKDAAYKKRMRRIEETADREYAVPARLQASLRPYQEEGFRWMARLCDWGSGACLADDMGLGKTVQTIAMLLHKASEGASLVIVPASLLLNWEQEIARFAPSLTPKVLHGAGERETLLNELEPFDVVLTTYGVLVSAQELFCAPAWNVVVLDEAHTIKNKETKMSKAAMKLTANFRLLLTGTPLQNHLGEIWNLFQFMNPGMLGSLEQFSAKFIAPIEAGGNKERQELLKKLVNPFLLRRTKNEVLRELPGKTEIVVPVTLKPHEAVVYEAIRRHAEAQLMDDTANSVQTLAEITHLRQAASHIALTGAQLEGMSSKMETFFELFEEMEENAHRALVFSQFTSHLACFREELEKRNVPYLYLDGSTPIAERARLVKSFQTGEQPLFLISLKAGGLGLNLTAADFIIHLDPWWNPAIEDQASDRAYRIGQKRPVTVYRLISTDTIEEKIIELHRSKKDLADSLLEGTNCSHKLSREELLALIAIK